MNGHLSQNALKAAILALIIDFILVDHNKL